MAIRPDPTVPGYHAYVEPELCHDCDALILEHRKYGSVVHDPGLCTVFMGAGRGDCGKREDDPIHRPPKRPS